MSGKVDVVKKFLLGNPPAEIEKKVTLLKHFKDYLNKKQTFSSRLGPDGDP
jgi:hypothetical protein